jgi:P-type conjugative transfer protein TrbJ
MRTCRNPVRRRLAFASAAVVAFAAASAPRPAPAQFAVACVNCAQMATQMMEYATQAKQLAQEILSYKTLVEQYANMVINTVSIPQQVWATVQADIYRVQQLSQAVSVLTGNTGSILSRLQTARSYANSAGSLPSEMSGQFDYWQQTIGRQIAETGRLLHLQEEQQAKAATAIDQAQQHSDSAEGQKQALQAANELAAQNAKQLAQIQTTLTVTAQMQGAAIAVDADRRAREDAAMTRFTSGEPLPTDQGRKF